MPPPELAATYDAAITRHERPATSRADIVVAPAAMIDMLHAYAMPDIITLR